MASPKAIWTWAIFFVSSFLLIEATFSINNSEYCWHVFPNISYIFVNVSGSEQKIEINWETINGFLTLGKYVMLIQQHSGTTIESNDEKKNLVATIKWNKEKYTTDSLISIYATRINILNNVYTQNVYCTMSTIRNQREEIFAVVPQSLFVFVIAVCGCGCVFWIFHLIGFSIAFACAHQQNQAKHTFERKMGLRFVWRYFLNGVCDKNNIQTTATTINIETCRINSMEK